MKSTGQCQVTSVCQRCDDESSCVTEILISINEFRVYSSGIEVVVFLPVISVNNNEDILLPNLHKLFQITMFNQIASV